MIFRLARRRIETRYRGSILGLSWVVIEPLALLAIYTFVFSLVFHARWGTADPTRGDFSLHLFSGLIIYSIFSETVNDSPEAVRAAESYVKQMVFPAEVLAWVSVYAALFKFLISSCLLLLWYRLGVGHLELTALLFPVFVLPVILLTLGVTWFISALGVYFRDLGQLVGLGTMALLFLSPIFYPASSIPERYQEIYFLNPFARILQMSNQSFFDGVWPTSGELAIVFLIGWAAAWIGYAWFMRLKSGFADVL